MSSAPNRTVRLAVLMMFVSAAALLAGCGLLPGSKTQTITDPGNSFHFNIPSSWTATQSPGIITLYGDEEMPSVDSAIGKTPWYFVLSSKSSDKDMAKMLPELAKARSESRKWKNVTLGKATKTTLGKAKAYEMDIKATDEQKRSFEGKLLLARRGKTDVLVFAFTAPGSFKGSRYEDLKENFFWLVGSDAEMTATSTAAPDTKAKTKMKSLEKPKRE